MSTLPQLVDRVCATLQGFTKDQNEQTWLTGDITNGDLSLSVNEGPMVSQGIIEIGDELLWVSRVDKSSGAVTIAPFGRGYQSSIATAHTTGTAVLNNPSFPRVQVRTAIADTIETVYPDLYVLGSTEFPAIAARTTYAMPADADQVHRVTFETIGPTMRWAPLVRWNFDPSANLTRFPSGKSIDIYQEPMSGRTVRVTYIKPPTAFADDVTQFATATGLPSTAEDCIVYGACFRMSGFAEMPRLQLTSIESQMRSTQVAPGATQSASRHFLQLYQLSLLAERERLLRRDPVSTHYRYA